MKNWEKDLPPIVKERLARIGELTPQEKEKMIDSRKAESLLSQFYQGQIDCEELWRRLREEGKPSLLKEVQVRLLDSLGFETTTAELKRKKDAILAIETLKKDQNTSVIERNLNLIEDLRKKISAEIDQVYSSVKAEVERNPRLRVKQVQQGQNTIVVQLSVDEAIRQLPQWRDFLSNLEKRYKQEFLRLTDKLKRELK